MNESTELPEDLAIGEVVRLKSGSQKMQVTKNDGKELTTIWMNDRKIETFTGHIDLFCYLDRDNE